MALGPPKDTSVMILINAVMRPVSVLASVYSPQFK